MVIAASIILYIFFMAVVTLRLHRNKQEDGTLKTNDIILWLFAMHALWTGVAFIIFKEIYL